MNQKSQESDWDATLSSQLLPQPHPGSELKSFRKAKNIATATCDVVRLGDNVLVREEQASTNLPRVYKNISTDSLFPGRVFATELGHYM